MVSIEPTTTCHSMPRHFPSTSFTVPLVQRTHNAELILGSVYFTANILAATDRLVLLCRQSNIPSRGMAQFE